MEIRSNNVGTQSTTQTQETQDQTMRPQSMRTSTPSVDNPAAPQYASGVEQQSGADALPPPSASEWEHRILDAQLDLEMLMATVDELKWYLENADLTPEEFQALQDLVREGEHLLLDMESQLAHMEYGNSADFDGDGLSNEVEQMIGTDMWKVDTDGDGISDLVEDAMSHNAGLPVDPTQYDSSGLGVSDGIVFREEAEEAAASLGVPVNGPAMGGDTDGGDIFGTGGPLFNDDTPSSGEGGSGGSSEPAGPIGPQPGNDAVEVNLGAQSVSRGDGEETEPVRAGSMSVQSAGMQTQTADDADAPDDADADADAGAPIAADKWEFVDVMRQGNKEQVIIENDTNFEGVPTDVIINGTADNDNFLITQDGDDIVIYTDEKEIRIVNGVNRRVFLQDVGGDDTVVFHNVDQQVIHGGTGYDHNGDPAWLSGIFLPRGDSGFQASSATVQNETEEGSVYGYDYRSDQPDTEEPVVPTNTTIENVHTVWDSFRSPDGEVANNLTYGDSVRTSDERGSSFELETWEMTSSAPVDIHIPETVNNIPVRHVKVKEEGNDLVIYLQDDGERTLKKIVVTNGITYGNTDANGGNVTFHLPNGLNDPLGHFDQGYQFGGVKFDASELTQNYVQVIGGAGDDWVIGSAYVGQPGEMYDVIDGGAGNDILLAGGGAGVTLRGGEGHDMLKGSDHADLIEGGSDNDAIDGGQGSDRLYGGAGSDILVTRGDGNYIDGGGGGYDITNKTRGISNDTIEDIDYAGDDLAAAVNLEDIEGLIGSLGGITDEDRDSLLQAINDMIAEGDADMLESQLHQIFGRTLDLRTDSWGSDWEGGSPVDIITGSGESGSIGDLATPPPDAEEEEEPQS